MAPADRFHRNPAFAALDADHVLERIAGGNETDVYRSDDGLTVVKLKHEQYADIPAALDEARRLAAAAARYQALLGTRHTIPSDFLLARDRHSMIQVLTVQPFLRHARPLADLDLDRLTAAERRQLAAELRDIIRRAVTSWLRSGDMPDLYGRRARHAGERAAARSLRNLPERIWSFLVHRTILQSQNLLLTATPPRRVVLVDYDEVRRSPLYRTVYFLTRLMLFIRDLVVLQMRLG
jgi:hypothetical protein